MKIENYQFPKSSFLSMDKDYGIIFNWMMKNNRFKKLLYYSTPDCLDKPNLTDAESVGLFGKNIKIVPKLSVDGQVLTYVIVSFDNFTPNATNPEFRDNIITFDIICHFDQWQLQDFELRPYKIAAEIDTMFNNKHLSGIGELQFLGANQIVLTDEFAGLTLMYQTIHGYDGEDSKYASKPGEKEDINSNWDNMYNNPHEL